MQLCRRVLGGLPEGSGSRQGHPADQAGYDHAIRAAVRKSRMIEEARASTATKTYRPAMGAGWWTRKRHYFLYMVREFTALPLALWLLWLLYEIYRAGRGPAAFYPPSSIAFVVFSVICLAFALYHSFTF